ncbi:hypothetical protein J1N35_015446 [Gossypium stocksii]|uniref:Uncharacterized protein n=1 Tax=Gossypium stocksii TaxID=47602 RepID=A0A9D4A9V7_9ROSI|nr:hypothetical protein J1N35_015446 [Gossypium stocksii]
MLQISDLSEKEAFYWFEDRLKPWAKHELHMQGITKLTIAMVEVESFVELGPTKYKFKSSKSNGKGNGERSHEKDKEGHSDDDNNTGSTSGNGKQRVEKRGSNNPRDKGKRIKYFICQEPHMARKYPKKSMISAIKIKDELEEAKPCEKKTSMINSMVLTLAKRNGKEGFMFVDINIVGQKQSVLVGTGASNLFILKKATKKLGLLIRKLNKKIKITNSDEAPTAEVAQNVELQIDE